MTTELRLHNTLTGARERFEPLSPHEVGLYSCGPTVYARQHLGNLRTYLFADLLKRTLRLFGHRVRHVINITDVGHLTSDADEGDDKLELAARQQGESAWDVAAHWTRVFQRDLARLGVEPPDLWCRATDHVPEQIAMIRKLEERGLTYRLADGIYLDTGKLDHYGVFGRSGGEQARAQERIAGAGDKRQATDFALWKLSPARGPRRQMQWPSPWGVGFPGWHIECSAMATKYLGEQFDIHTGGIDHVPVHHENEIAQSEAALGVRPWVRYWLHGGWLMLAGDKMAKSAGGAPSLDDVVERGFDPLAFRYLVLGAHYRTQLSFGWDVLAEADATWRRLRARGAELARVSSVPVVGDAARRHRAAFRAALGDDLNAPRALASLWAIVRDTGLSPGERRALLLELDDVLGLDLLGGVAEPVLHPRLAALVVQRAEARRARDFARADALRAELTAQGVELEDLPDGETRARVR